MVTDDGGAFLRVNGRLHLVGFGSDIALAHSVDAVEAVMDSTGEWIVYRPAGEDPPLRLLDRRSNVESELPVRGSAPAMSPNGRYIAYIAASGELGVYDRAVASEMTGLLDRKVTSIAVSGYWLFAAAVTGEILRMNLDDGAVTTMLEPLPRIDALSNANWVSGCRLNPCYGYLDPFWYVSSGSRVKLVGRDLHLLTAWTGTMSGGLPSAQRQVSVGIDDETGAAFMDLPSDLQRGAEYQIRMQDPTRSVLQVGFRLIAQ